MAAPVPTDPYFANVSLLLHGTGANDSTVITDSSLSAIAVTPSGNCRIRTAVSKFGPSSIYCDGTGDYATTGVDVDLYLPGDFTMEGWIYRTTAGAKMLLGDWTTAYSYYPFIMQLAASTLKPTLSLNGGAVSTTGPDLAVSTWHHLALSRISGVIKYFGDGVEYYSASYATEIGVVSGYRVGIGSSLGGAGNTSECYIQDIRITKGVGRYPSAFTPPTAAFPNS